MRFLRTVPTRRLLAGLAGLLIVCVGGTAIAVAAAGNGPVPKRRSLAAAVHRALTGRPVRGLSATINFTNNLIGSSQIQGTDPLLNGGQGRLWVGEGRIRLEIQSDNGDAQVVFNHGSFWAYDPAMNVVYRGKLPTGSSASSVHRSAAKPAAIPTIAQIQKDLNALAKHLSLSGAHATDVGGQPAYRVSVSPRSGGGLIGALKLAWDANHGIPLDFGVYAKGNSTPVLELQATGVSYGHVSRSVFNIKPPRATHVVNISVPKATSGATSKAKHSANEITGVRAVRKHLRFTLAAPGVLAGRARHSVSLIGSAGHHGAALFYGKGLGGILVIERPASAGGSVLPSTASSSNDGPGLTIPTVKIDGATAQQLPTPLGTVVEFSLGGVSYLVVGSVDSSTADAAARGL